MIDSPCYLQATERRAHVDVLLLSLDAPGPDDRRPPRHGPRCQVSPRMDSNQACCRAIPVPHEPDGADETSGGIVRECCYNCHMPYTSYGLLKALRSHQITGPSVTTSVQTGRPNACNACHLDKPLGWTATYSTMVRKKTDV